MKEIIQLIQSAIDWQSLISGLVILILAWIKRGKDLKTLNRYFGKDAVKEALSQSKKDSV